MNEERMLPDDVGVWFNDNGELCTIYLFQTIGHRRYSVFHGSYPSGMSCGGSAATNSELEKALEGARVEPGRWRRADPPKFEPQEPRPPMVWARSRYKPSPCGRYDNWFVWSAIDGSFRCVANTYQYSAWELTVIPHPQNDPEAVRIIEEAQRD